MSTQINTRSIILDILTEINEKGAYSNQVLGAALSKYQYLSHTDRAFISRVVMGSVERRLTLDYIADRFSKTPTAGMKPVIRNILRMSIYQLLYMEGVEDFAACNEAVKLADKRGFRGLKGFVNGVLRTIARSKDTLPMPDGQKISEFLSVQYATPEWIVRKWMEQYGRENAVRILASQYEERPLTIRCNVARITPEELEERLGAQGISAYRLPDFPEALEIADYDYLEKIKEFREGLFSVQDVSSMFVARAAGLKRGDYVIDVCAAPGGKSLHAAELLADSGFVDARDLTPAKAAFIEENIERLGLTNIKAAVRDATARDESSVGKADVVLADLPCSGLGVIGRKPDIKYNASPEGCAALAKLQREILTVVSEYVKPQGTLLYSTCTLNSEENIRNASWFSEQFDFEPIPFAEALPKSLCPDTAKQGYAEFLPGVTGNLDGFFIAKFRRKTP